MPAYRKHCKPWKREEAKRMRRNPTPAEATLWKYLSQKQFHGLKFRRQSVILGYIADFYCATCKLIIELDGSHHEQNRYQREYDHCRDNILKQHGFHVVRYSNQQVYNDIETLLQDLKQHCIKRPGPLRPRSNVARQPV